MKKINKILLRIRKRSRYPYLISASLEKIGCNVFIYDSDVNKESRGSEELYYSRIDNLKKVKIIRNIDNISPAEYLYIDMMMDNKYISNKWKAVIYFDERESVAKPKLFDHVDKYLWFGDSTAIEDQRVEPSPYWPHPNIYLNEVKKYKPHKNRSINILGVFTPKPKIREVYLNKIKKNIDKLSFKNSLNEGNINPFLFSDKKSIPYDQWMSFMNNTRWCLDLPGHGYFTHRLMESCLSSSAPIMHEVSAKLYKPALRNEIECLTYNENTLIDVLLFAQKIPYIDSEKIGQNAKGYYNKYHAENGLRSLLQKI